MDDMEAGKTPLPDYLKATESSAILPIAAIENSLRHMLGPKGNPTLNNFLTRLMAWI